LGTPSARAAAERLPASAIRAKIRRSVRSSTGAWLWRYRWLVGESFQKWNGVSRLQRLVPEC
jgi:hypothetical protein